MTQAIRNLMAARQSPRQPGSQRLAAAALIETQAAELAKFKALAETLARELQQIEVDASGNSQKPCYVGVQMHDAQTSAPTGIYDMC